MLLVIGIKLDGEDEQVKKRKKICLSETIVTRNKIVWKYKP